MRLLEEWALQEPINSTTAMRKWLNSAANAWRGFITMLKEERNSRLELIIAILVVGLSFWLKVSSIEWCLILICIGALLSAEAMNTSIERLSDVASPGWNDKIRDVKDIAAGSVFVISIIGSIIGLIIFIPKIIFRLF